MAKVQLTAYSEKEKKMTMSGRRVSVLLAVAAMMVLMMTVSGVALAQGGDVCA
jgi:hypothetical protein